MYNCTYKRTPMCKKDKYLKSNLSDQILLHCIVPSMLAYDQPDAKEIV
ncbi:hypothetical protein AXFE_07540 [Acidithrix ferrooxidans]|uniref:Uncharacterized protein n=1 Tax=Acidithrix ferrooxidans TaxID=1280514 RepID=A0A0D8HMR7_9ACTN|nr:hypothetical protein AXFE_07540 [Acidithrix ferrooxidans]